MFIKIIIWINSQWSVTFHMQRQMIRTRKRPLTQGTFKGFLSSVLSKVPGKFIGPSEFPCTSFPGTHVWLFTCNKEKENCISMCTSSQSHEIQRLLNELDDNNVHIHILNFYNYLTTY